MVSGIQFVKSGIFSFFLSPNMIIDDYVSPTKAILEFSIAVGFYSCGNQIWAGVNHKDV